MPGLGLQLGLGLTTQGGRDLLSAVPVLLSSTPSDDATDVAVDTTIVLTFDVGVAAGTGNIVLRDISGTPAVVETFNVATGTGDGGGTVVFSGSAVTITPGSSLNASDDYSIQVASTAVENALNASLTYAGIANDTTLNFTTLGASAGTSMGLLLSLTYSS